MKFSYSEMPPLETRNESHLSTCMYATQAAAVKAEMKIATNTTINWSLRVVLQVTFKPF